MTGCALTRDGRRPNVRHQRRANEREGLLAPAAKPKRLALARELLAMPAANPQAREDAQAFMRRVAQLEINTCPHCKLGRWRVLQVLAAERTVLAGVVPVDARRCRGPP